MKKVQIHLREITKTIGFFVAVIILAIMLLHIRGIIYLDRDSAWKIFITFLILFVMIVIMRIMLPARKK